MQRARQPAALALMVASGSAGLGYQIVWTQQGALWLGHEAAAVLAVVTAFFGGLAVGALTLGARIERSRQPGRWYAACELTIAAWSLVLALGMAPFSDWVLELTGAQPTAAWQWSVAFFGTFLVLLPATAAMGATLPAMERVMAQLRRQGQSIAALYASNTLGAVLGVLAAAFWLVPEFGLARTAGVCAAFNLICAAAVLALFSQPLPSSELPARAPTPLPTPLATPLSTPTTTPPPSRPPTPLSTPPNTPQLARRPLLLLAATGLLGIGYEVLVVRVLSQVTEDTVYTFAILLAIYLVGTALGAAAYQRGSTGRMPGRHAPDALGDRMLWALAAACLLGVGSLWAAEDLRNAVQQGLGASLGTALGGALAAEGVLALVSFGLPTFLMGALFSHLSTQARAAGIGFGRSLGVNTLGAAAAPLLFGVVLVPVLGAKAALLLVAAGYLALSSARTWRTPATAVVGGATLALALWAPPLAFVDVPEGGRVVSYREGTMAAVSVVEDADGIKRLRINNRQQEGSSASLLADARQAWLPLLLHPVPQRALFLGLGTGVTASAAAEDPTLQVDAAELLPEVIAASVHFTRAINPRLHLVAADARRFVRAAGSRYDLIVSDNFHPARSGSGALYTVEHFQAVRARLTASGVFCQWLPLHQLDLETLRSIVQAFIAVYPGGWAMLATNSLETPVLGLVARSDDGRFDLRQLRQRLRDTALPQRLADFGIADEFALLGGFVAGPRALARFAGDAPLNTDDRPIVAYRAPRITYAPDSLPRDRLLALLQQLKIEPVELIDVSTDVGADFAADIGVDLGADFAVDAKPDSRGPQRLAAYWAARNRFIDAGRSVRPSADLRQMLSQVREPLLSVLRISPDFRPAYDPLLRMAAALGRTDAVAARALLTELVQAQPTRPEAAQALLELAGHPP